MGRVVHFEIHADDMGRAKRFYEAVFDWNFTDFTKSMGKPYFLIKTGKEEEPGINGGLMYQLSSPIHENERINNVVCTIQVDDYDQTEAAILNHGGRIFRPKEAIFGMAWQGYYFDTEANVFGIHQPDQAAK